MFKVSAVPPRRSAMLTVFRGATAINDGTTAEPLRPWRCNYGLCRTCTAVAPRLRCDGGRSKEHIYKECRLRGLSVTIDYVFRVCAIRLTNIAVRLSRIDLRGAVRALRHRRDASTRSTRHCDCFNSACANKLVTRT